MEQAEQQPYRLESTPDIAIRLGSLSLDHLEGVYAKLDAQKQRITRDMQVILSEMVSRHERLFDDNTY